MGNINILTFTGTQPEPEEWDFDALDTSDFESARAEKLFKALDIVELDPAVHYALAQHRVDGRWGLLESTGDQTTGEKRRWAFESRASLNRTRAWGHALEGYPEHLGRIRVVDAKSRVLLRTHDLASAAALTVKDKSLRVLLLVGAGTQNDPCRSVAVSDEQLAAALTERV